MIIVVKSQAPGYDCCKYITISNCYLYLSLSIFHYFIKGIISALCPIAYSYTLHLLIVFLAHPYSFHIVHMFHQLGYLNQPHRCSQTTRSSNHVSLSSFKTSNYPLSLKRLLGSNIAQPFTSNNLCH